MQGSVNFGLEGQPCIFKLGGELEAESFMRGAKLLGAGTLFGGSDDVSFGLNYKIGDVDLRVDINTSRA